VSFSLIKDETLDLPIDPGPRGDRQWKKVYPPGSSGLWLRMLLEFLILASALYVGFNIGANDAANTMGACVGGGALNLRKAVIFASVFVLLGGLFGGNVTRTIAQGILPPGQLTNTAAIVCLFSAGGIVAIATIIGLPVSTSHAIVLSLVGAGMAMQTRIEWGNLLLLATAWVLLPLAMIALSYAIVKVMSVLLSRVESLVSLEILLKYLLIFSGLYASFALGASHAGLAGGMVEGSAVLGRFSATLLGSAAIAIGVLLLSSRVIRTVGEGITPLSPASAFSMQISASIGLTVCSFLGIPVSSSQSVVAAAVGVGLAQGGSAVNVRQVWRITAAWILVPLGTMVLSFLILALMGG